MTRHLWKMAGVLAPLAISACAPAVPPELADARRAYGHVSAGPEAPFAPGALSRAKASLDQAEIAFAGRHVRTAGDLAYVSSRRSEQALVLGRTEMERRHIADAAQAIAQAEAARADREGALARSESDRAARVEGDLSSARAQQAAASAALEGERQARIKAETDAATEKTRRSDDDEDRQRVRGALNAEEEARIAVDKQRIDDEAKLREAQEKGQADAAALSQTKNQLEVERRARADAEANARSLGAILGSVARVRSEPRGVVITLSGSVVFPSAKTSLTSAARSRLDDVAQALSSRPGGSLVVEGYTDSRGSSERNLDLSDRRARAVMGYLIERGVSSSRIRAEGFGSARPIADNHTAEGRANNRRVEIVIEPSPASTTP